MLGRRHRCALAWVAFAAGFMGACYGQYGPNTSNVLAANVKRVLPRLHQVRNRSAREQRPQVDSAGGWSKQRQR
jgi:hypothetical protein